METYTQTAFVLKRISRSIQFCYINVEIIISKGNSNNDNNNTNIVLLVLFYENRFEKSTDYDGCN